MNRLTIDGSLTVHSALIDFTTDSARCVGVFQSNDHAALKVEYAVALTHDLITILSRAFVVAGLPLLRAPSVAVSLPVSDGGHNNSNGNGHGGQPPPSRGAACRLCGAALYARAVPLGYCRICRTTRQAECVLPESADATP